MPIEQIKSRTGVRFLGPAGATLEGGLVGLMAVDGMSCIGGSLLDFVDATPGAEVAALGLWVATWAIGVATLGVAGAAFGFEAAILTAAFAICWAAFTIATGGRDWVNSYLQSLVGICGVGCAVSTGASLVDVNL